MTTDPTAPKRQGCGAPCCWRCNPPEMTFNLVPGLLMTAAMLLLLHTTIYLACLHDRIVNDRARECSYFTLP